MTVLINLYAQPSAGKTTTMADLFTRLKYLGIDVEICTEWVKKWAWEDKKIDKYDEFYIFGKETYRQKNLFGKVEYIISDSPVYLTDFYQYYYNNSNTLHEATKEFYRLAERDGVRIYNFFLIKNKPYNPKGRYQSEDEAKVINNSLLEWMKENVPNFIVLDCEDKSRVEEIFKAINKDVVNK